MLRRETMGPLGAILPVEPEPEPALELEQARTHAAQLIIAAIEKRGTWSVPAMIEMLNFIAAGRSDAHMPRNPPIPKASTIWEN